ncbi:MAG: hypothetical protein K2Q10_06835, partial [Rhodospirillales bacterium]|nr:hypothetical protein [Rhodospirillales bacterium]
MTAMKPVRWNSRQARSSLAPMIMALEPRMMFDGAAVVDAAHAVADMADKTSVSHAADKAAQAPALDKTVADKAA